MPVRAFPFRIVAASFSAAVWRIMSQALGCKRSQSIQTAQTESHAQADTSSLVLPPTSKFALLGKAARRRYLHSALRLLLAEIRALGRRIRWVLEIREVELLRGKDSIRKWMDDSLVGGSQSYKRAYICHMQQLETRYPFLSIFDLLLLAQTWKAGSEWNGRSDTSHSRDESCDQLSQVAQMREVTPAGVAGVTRKDECTRHGL